MQSGRRLGCTHRGRTQLHLVSALLLQGSAPRFSAAPRRKPTFRDLRRLRLFFKVAFLSPPLPFQCPSHGISYSSPVTNTSADLHKQNPALTQHLERDSLNPPNALCHDRWVRGDQEKHRAALRARGPSGLAGSPAGRAMWRRFCHKAEEAGNGTSVSRTTTHHAKTPHQ